MNILQRIRGWFNQMWTQKAKEEFDIHVLSYEDTDKFLKECADIYRGKPYWLDDDIKTVNMAKAICSELARLTTMNIDITVEGSARAKWLQEQTDDMRDSIRQWTEYGCGFGTVVLKPNGVGVDVITPAHFRITETKNDRILGAIFYDRQYDGKANKWYIRLEYHRFEGEKYIISNRCYIGNSETDFDHRIDIEKTPWAGLSEDTTVTGTDRMLFGVFKMPNANNMDIDSPMGLPVFADAIEEIHDFDIAYSRNVTEIEDSSRTVIIDSDRLLSGGRIGVGNKNALIKEYQLPRFVKAVEGTGQGDIYHEINPTLQTGVRIQGINALLSQIGFKCGFSNGYFVFNEKSGLVTATQVESSDRRTLQLVNDIREQLKHCLDDLIYALDRFADAYGLATRGTYEIAYKFADLTLNEDEDRMRWYSYVTQGLIPFSEYLMRYEGMTEEEANKISIQVQQNQPEPLFT